MSKRDPEFLEASRHFKAVLDLSNADMFTIGDLLGPSLVREHWRYWQDQDRWNPELVYDPADIAHGAADPSWYQTDGCPSRGGSPADIASRKWRRRAELWMQFYGPHAWHIVDWLLYARRQNAAWLHNLDITGTPKKLIKCRDLGALLAEADKGLRSRPRAGGDILLGMDDEVFVADLGTSHTLVELLSPRALRKEGTRMHNCLRNGEYDCRLGQLFFSYYSVRDPNGKPLATLEVQLDQILQFTGPLNSAPSVAVSDLVIAYADEIGWKGLMEAIRGFPILAVDDERNVNASSTPPNRRVV
ncbi:hypothetical protein GAO09_08545 [Rhizobiales bacterium RZME27]|uniref:Uncharacterized protein n=1 Tax=Endobacterium cereale TaxID=2663029 RepID=A0A6A8A4Z1_9HYPH|nr:hypothetical protein [Endobacterium cereale]MQY46103.1 hypothetical protein [Endobacterium cereale]